MVHISTLKALHSLRPHYHHSATDQPTTMHLHDLLNSPKSSSTLSPKPPLMCLRRQILLLHCFSSKSSLKRLKLIPFSLYEDSAAGFCLHYDPASSGDQFCTPAPQCLLSVSIFFFCQASQQEYTVPSFFVHSTITASC